MKILKKLVAIIMRPSQERKAARKAAAEEKLVAAKRAANEAGVEEYRRAYKEYAQWAEETGASRFNPAGEAQNAACFAMGRAQEKARAVFTTLTAAAER